MSNVPPAQPTTTPHDPIREINLEGAIKLGSQTLKSLELVNGGAAIGILTFYGNAVKDGVKTPIHVCSLRVALIIFGVGTFLALAASVLAYLAQLQTQLSNAEETGDAGKPRRIGAIIFGLISAAAFLAGVICSAFAFG